MFQREAPRRLSGRIELDDADLGGEHEGKSGRGSENKVPFVAAVQTNAKGHPITVRFDRVKAFTSEEIKRWSANSLDAKAHVISDGLGRSRQPPKVTKVSLPVLGEKPLKNQSSIG